MKKSKADREGRAMIYLRITVNGKRAELSTGRKIVLSGKDTWKMAEIA
ncbi:MAG: Arm DNA-binding domain-containing protein [Bacteroidota bacterium]